jgi:hypothetical protein
MITISFLFKKIVSCLGADLLNELEHLKNNRTPETNKRTNKEARTMELQDSQSVHTSANFCERGKSPQYVCEACSETK